jgi:predicted permease
MMLNRFSAWIHKRLLLLYPAEFRAEFGAEMEQDFSARMAHRTRRGQAAVWAETFLDWLASMPREQLEVTWRDLRASARGLKRSPLFTLAVLLSLGVGIAGASVVFTIANSLLIQTPLADPSIFVGVLRGDGTSEPASWPDYIDYRDRNRSFAQFTAWNVMPVFLGRGDRSQSVMAETVADNYFEVLQTKPFLGRLFRPGDCPSTCPQEVILSHRFWRQTYGGDPGAIGRQVALSGIPAAVIGIAPEGFDGTLAPVMTDIWIHVENRRLTDPELFSDRHTRWLAIAGRLKPGVSEAQAIAELNAVDRQLQQEHRYTNTQERRLWPSVKRGIGIPLIRSWVEFIVGLLGAVAALVLLISCANVANMLLARAAARRQETAMRRALGAGDYRLIRLSLTESMMLAVLGGVAGGILSIWITVLLPELQPPANDLYTYRMAIHQDFHVWAFTSAISLFCGLLFGILPALQAARAECLPAIRNQDAQGRPRWFARKILISCQVASSVVLLVTAGLFYRSFGSQQEIGPGFAITKGLIVPLNLNLVSYAGDQEKGRRFFDSVKERVDSLPGVESAGLASYVPLNAQAPQIEVWREAGAPIRVGLDLIDPGFLTTMKVRLVGGRNFTSHDRDGSQPVALADERLVRRLWPGAAPIEALGRTLRAGKEKSPLPIVGVVASDFRPSLTEAPRPMLFLPVAQRYSSMLYLVIRTAPPPEELTEPVRRAVESVDDTVSLRRMRTLEGQVSDVLWPIRTGARVVTWACVVAVLLAVLGLYGVIAYSMSRRQREMAIRMALGARPTDVLRLVLTQSLSMTLWGIVFGLPLAVVANVALARMLYGLRAIEPVVSMAGIAIWFTISCLACIPPAWRAVRNSLAAIREPG